MWACTPTSSTPGRSSRAATASAAAPEETENPNLESSWPVRTNSCVCASTPGVTRTRTLGRVDVGAEDSSRPPRRAISSKESTTMRPTPWVSASASSSVDLLLPCRTRRSAGTLAERRHMELAAGRDVEVHALLVGQPGHGPAQEGLGGVGDTFAPGGDGLPAGVAQVVLVVDEERGAELLRQLQEVDPADAEVPLLVHGGGARQEVPLQGCGRHVVVGRHGRAGYGSNPAPRRARDRVERIRSTIVPCSCVGTGAHPAPVAQRIEHRPPEPVAQVRVLPGALCDTAGGALQDIAGGAFHCT